jgi:hypothetical protein
MTKNGNSTTLWRITELEKKVDNIDEKVEKIMMDVLTIKTKVNVITAVNIGAIIMGLVVGRMIK